MSSFVQHITQRATKRVLSEKGFTLVEMLAALAVLVMLTGMVAIGTQVATTAYGAGQYASQADVLAGEIENALSAHYRYTASENPELLVEDGRFVVKNVKGVKKELLNSGAYGNCQVSLLGGAASLKPVRQSDGSYVTQGAYEITKTTGDSAPRAYSFYFKSYGDSTNDPAYGGIGASDGSGGSGGSGDSGNLTLDQARSALNELIITARTIEQGKKYYDAFYQLQVAIGTAEGWRDNGEASIQQLKDAKQALQDAIDAFNGSPERPDGSGDAGVLDSVRVTIEPGQQAYAIGQGGVKAFAEAIYNDGNTYEHSVSWVSSNTGVATVATNENGEGELTFVGPGSATITATIDGVSGSAVVTVQGDVFVITIGGHTYSEGVVAYDNSGTLHAGSVYSYNGSYYYVNQDIVDPWNTDLEARSNWQYSAGGVAKITETFVDASAFTIDGGRLCPDTITKGTLYYDAAHGKLYSCHQTQMWMTRPDIDASGWDDVSGLLAG